MAGGSNSMHATCSTNIRTVREHTRANRRGNPAKGLNHLRDASRSGSECSGLLACSGSTHR
eukprot:3534451-Prymnesium_polylepis.1